MANEQGSFGTSRGLGPHATRRGLLQAGLLQGLAIGTLALGRRAALVQPGHAHAHMPELGVTQSPLAALTPLSSGPKCCSASQLLHFRDRGEHPASVERSQSRIG